MDACPAFSTSFPLPILVTIADFSHSVRYFVLHSQKFHLTNSVIFNILFFFFSFSGKKQSKNHGCSVSTSTVNPQQEKTKEKKSNEASTVRNPKSSCEVPRSPTLPAEIRRKSIENIRESPALVARLMGLEALPASPESLVEKRQKLLGALQRCDDDLKALKKIIDAVQTPEPVPSPKPVVVKRTVCEVKCSVVNGEQQQPSPVSVLDEFNRSPLSSNCHSGRHSFGKSSIFFLFFTYFAF